MFFELNVVNKPSAQDFPAPTGGVGWRPSATWIVGAMCFSSTRYPILGQCALYRPAVHSILLTEAHCS